MNESVSDSIAIIKKTQNVIAMTVGISMGILMLIYFFTFSMFADQGYGAVLWFQAITTIFFMVIYIFINKISFKLSLLLHKRKFKKTPWFSELSNQHINKSCQDIVDSIDN